MSKTRKTRPNNNSQISSQIVLEDFFKNFQCEENNNNVKNNHNNRPMRIYRFYGSLKSMFNIHLIRNYFDIDYADKLFDDLKQIQYNSDEESMVRMPTGRVKIPRQQTAYGEPGVTYSFSGISVLARNWTRNDDSLDAKVGRELKYVSQHVGKSACSIFNYALINNYHNQNHSIGYHSDDEKELGKYPIVAGISLGQEREIYFKSNLTNEVIKISLPHNSLVIMHYPTNSYWKHSIPKTTRHLGQRISLTFRSVDKTLLNK